MAIIISKNVIITALCKLNNKQVSQKSLATVCVRSGQLMNELHILDLLWLEQSAILVTLYVICVVCEKNDR